MSDPLPPVTAVAGPVVVLDVPPVPEMLAFQHWDGKSWCLSHFGSNTYTKEMLDKVYAPRGPTRPVTIPASDAPPPAPSELRWEVRETKTKELVSAFAVEEHAHLWVDDAEWVVDYEITDTHAARSST